MNDKCSICGKKADFICFCSEITVCSSCIGYHLTQEPILKHKPVSLKEEHIKSIIAESLPQIQGTEDKIFAENQRKQALLEAVNNKLSRELNELNQFQDLGVHFAKEIVKTTLRTIGNTEEVLVSLVRKRCESTRAALGRTLESYSAENTADPLAAKLLSCKTPEEVADLKLIQKGMDFNEVKIKEILVDAFKFSVSIEPKSVVAPAERRMSLDLPSAPVSRIGKSRSSIGGITQKPVRQNTSPFTKENKSRIPGHAESPQTERLSRLAQPVKKALGTSLYYFEYKAEQFFTYNPTRDSLSSEVLPRQEIGVKGTAWVLTGVGSLMLTGGFLGIPKHTTWFFDINSRDFILCANMKTSRFYHSSVCINDFVYVIGGFNKSPLAECERYSLSQKKWQKVGSLKTPRFKHSACVYKGRIFVAGGVGQATFECYNAITNSFSALRCVLSSPGPSVMFPYKERIILLHNNESSAFDPSTSLLSEFTKFESKTHWNPGYSLVLNKEALYLKKRHLVRIDLENGVPLSS